MMAERLSKNLYLLDSHYLAPQRTAVYVLKTPNNNLILFDCAVTTSQPVLFEQIDALGFKPGNITDLFLSHAHLDHAGGAAALAKANANLTVHAHADCLRHLSNPAKLEAGVRQIYGDDFFNRVYGTIEPLNTNQTHTLNEGDQIVIDGITISVLYTPGHAWHHHSYIIGSEDAIFVGDAFGQCYKEFTSTHKRFIFPSTPPTQLDPESMLASFEKIANSGISTALLSHYGAIDQLPLQLIQLNDLLSVYLEVGSKQYQQPRDTLINHWIDIFHQAINNLGMTASRHQVYQYLQFDASLISAGVSHYFQKQNRSA